MRRIALPSERIGYLHPGCQIPATSPAAYELEPLWLSCPSMTDGYLSRDDVLSTLMLDSVRVLAGTVTVRQSSRVMFKVVEVVFNLTVTARLASWVNRSSHQRHPWQEEHCLQTKR